MTFKERYQAAENAQARKRGEANAVTVKARQWLLDVLEETEEVGCRVEPAKADGTYFVFIEGWDTSTGDPYPVCSVCIESVDRDGSKYYVYFTKGIRGAKQNAIGNTATGLPLLREHIHLQLVNWILEIKDTLRGAA